MSPIDQLKSVLCDPTGKCCITGSNEDRAIVNRALQALAQTEQAPVPWSQALEDVWAEQPAQQAQPKVRTGNCLLVGVCASEGHKIAPQRPWVGLTDDEVIRCIPTWGGTVEDVARAIEAKLKEKNT